jgi:hypothetical protein
MPNNETEATVFELGRLIVNVSAMEESLHDAIWLLSSGDDPSANMQAVVQVLTARMRFLDLVDKFGTLCRDLGTARIAIEDVQKYCNHLGSLNDRRNSFVHAAWNFRDEGLDTRYFKRTAKPNTGFSLNVRSVTRSDIAALSDDFIKAERKLWEIVP